MPLNVVIFGLSLSSSWGNGHATTYRALVAALADRGHCVTFIERDQPWYRDHRDLSEPSFCTLELFSDLADVPVRFGERVARADLVILGSYVPEGAAIGDWLLRCATGVTAFYDIDTPVTLESLARGHSDYIASALIPRFDLYLSFAGGPVLDLIEGRYGSPRARALYCSVDCEQHHAVEPREARWDLGYLGTYSADRQPGLQSLLIEPARQLPDMRFVVAGPQYPADIDWPANVERIGHVPPGEHAAFYGAQRFTLNLTRAAMKETGYSPSVRLFEAAACSATIISDVWLGIEHVFEPGREILLVDSSQKVIDLLTMFSTDARRRIGVAARARALRSHSGDARAAELEGYVHDVVRTRRPRAGDVTERCQGDA